MLQRAEKIVPPMPRMLKTSSWSELSPNCCRLEHPIATRSAFQEMGVKYTRHALKYHVQRRLYDTERGHAATVGLRVHKGKGDNDCEHRKESPKVQLAVCSPQKQSFKGGNGKEIETGLVITSVRSAPI